MSPLSWPEIGWGALVLLLTLPLSGCVATLPEPVSLADSFAGSSETRQGIVLIRASVLEARFVDGSASPEWEDSPSLSLTFPVVDSSRASVEPMQEGVLRNMEFPSNASLEVRLKDPNVFAGYRLGWGLRMADLTNPETAGKDPTDAKPDRDGSVDALEACRQVNLNGRSVRAPHETYATPVPSPGVYIVMAEVLEEQRRVGMVCQPLLATVSVNWTVHGLVHPLGAGMSLFFSEVESPEYSRMADEFTFDVGQPRWEGGGTRIEGRLHVATKYRGTWTPTSGTWIDADVRASGSPVFSAFTSCRFDWLGEMPDDPTDLAAVEFGVALD